MDILPENGLTDKTIWTIAATMDGWTRELGYRVVKHDAWVHTPVGIVNMGMAWHYPLSRSYKEGERPSDSDQ